MSKQAPSEFDPRWLEGISRPVNDVRMELDKSGSSLLSIRLEGASIRDLTLSGKRILRSPDFDNLDFVQPLKIDATHTMLPPGPDTAGPQHGPSRYLDYEIESSSQTELMLSARDPLHQLGHSKVFRLGTNSLEIVDEIVRQEANPLGISLGEHFYFQVDQADMNRIRLTQFPGASDKIEVIKTDGSKSLGNIDTFWEEVIAGRAVFYPGFSGLQDMWVPNIGTVRLQAEAISSVMDNVPLGMLIWHRPETNSFCVEPVAGFSVDETGKANNQGLTLNFGDTLRLTSKVSLSPSSSA